MTANLLALCGSGTSLCHGAYHGSPYVYEGHRRDSEWVRRRIGETIVRERPDTIEYIVEKLGEGPGRALLERAYYIAVA